MKRTAMPGGATFGKWYARTGDPADALATAS
jgi:hypothetical protein